MEVFSTWIETWIGDILAYGLRYILDILVPGLVYVMDVLIHA
jgi:hypothetical protein